MRRVTGMIAVVLAVGGLAMGAPRRTVSLDGEWMLATDRGNVGKKGKWYASGPRAEAQPARVPAALEETFPGYDGVTRAIKERRHYDADYCPYGLRERRANASQHSS